MSPTAEGGPVGSRLSWRCVVTSRGLLGGLLGGGSSASSASATAPRRRASATASLLGGLVGGGSLGGGLLGGGLGLELVGARLALSGPVLARRLLGLLGLDGFLGLALGLGALAAASSAAFWRASFSAASVSSAVAAALPNLSEKRWTRPPVSTNFCLPV